MHVFFLFFSFSSEKKTSNVFVFFTMNVFFLHANQMFMRAYLQMFIFNDSILILVMFCLLFFYHLPIFIFFIILLSVSPMNPGILFTLSLEIPCKYSAIIIVIVCICQAIDDKLTIQILNSFFNTGNKSWWDDKWISNMNSKHNSSWFINSATNLPLTTLQSLILPEIKDSFTSYTADKRASIEVS